MASPLQSLQNQDSVSYLTQREAAEIDETLMGPLGFSVDQLMELAGLSVAVSIAEVYKPAESNRVLAICGPGNNGGDGLVAARHLDHFGYKPFVCYPKLTPKPLYNSLVTQLESLSIPFLSVDDLLGDLSKDFDILLDAMFGFSFHGTPRPPFDDLIQRLICLHNDDQTQQKSPVIVSVDIPSGWHVEEGDVTGKGIKPDMLVVDLSPHLLQGNLSFISPHILAHLSLLEEQLEANLIDQFPKWFDDAVAAGLQEPNAMSLSTTSKDGDPYTNYDSQKARQLSENPNVSVLFYWEGLHRQVRVEGSVQKPAEYCDSWETFSISAIRRIRGKILRWKFDSKT
ncbi:hypothetical protein SLE2022_325600 [Rubroshorea leprosula]